MKNKKQLYELTDRDLPTDFEEYLQGKKEMLKQEKKDYKKRTVQQKKQYLSFGQEYRNFIVAIAIVLLCVCAGIVWRVQKNHFIVADTGTPQPVVTKLVEKNNKMIKDDQQKKASGTVKKKTKKHVAWKVGDVVYYSGTVQYKASQKGAKKEKCSAGKAKITKINKNGTHQYHIKSVRSEDNIYGWVDGRSLKRVK